MTRSYRGSDAGGKRAPCRQTITVNDTAAPAIGCPAAVAVACASAVPAPDTASVTASDNCGGTPERNFTRHNISPNHSANHVTLTQTNRATDACGNSATCTQTITVNDQPAPAI